MSHFAVLVITDEPTEEAVSKALAPYHEFECTGTDDEYVQNIDITKQCRSEYEQSRTNRYVDPEGNPHDPWADRFYREPTEEELKKIGPIAGSGSGDGMSWTSQDWGDGRGYRTKIHFLPEGWSVRQPTSEMKRFAEWLEDYHGKKALRIPRPRCADTPELRELWAHRESVIKATDRDEQIRLLNGYLAACNISNTAHPLLLTSEHKYGYAIVDDDDNVLQVIDRTNPEKHWDWWQIGGRFGNHFRLKPGRTGISFRADQLKDQLAFSQRFTAAFGAAEGNLSHQAELSTAIAEEETPKPIAYADIAFKGDIDFDAMRDDAEKKAAERYDKYHSLIATHPPIIQWEEMRDVVHKGDIEAARVAFREQPAIKATQQDDEFRWMFDHSTMAVDREKYLRLAREKAACTFAVVKDGTWYEKGEMGWWGCVSNEVPQEEWLTQFGMLVDSLADSAVLAVVDCHI